MRIVYIGNFEISFTTENHIASELESLGHEVIRWQENKTSAEELLDIDRTADFFLYTRTWDNVMGDWQKFLREKIKPLVGFHLDIWWGLEREKQIKKQKFFDCDILFTADGGHQKEWSKVNKKHIWLPPAVFSKECYLAEPKDEYLKDIVFVGSYFYHPEHPFRPELIDWLSQTYQNRFRLWGTKECIKEHELNRLYASAKIVIGDSLDSKDYISDRVTETLGRGGFLLHPENTALYKMGFRNGKHLVTYKRNDWQGLKDLIDFYLENHREREMIRLQGYNFVKQNHTYRHRMVEMIQRLKKEGLC